VDPWQCTSEKGEESSGRKLPALTPVPDGVEFGQRREAVNTIPHKPNRRFQSHKRSQLFIRTHLFRPDEIPTALLALARR